MDTTKLETYTMKDPTDNDRGQTVHIDGDLSRTYTLLAVLPANQECRYVLQHPAFTDHHFCSLTAKIKRNKSYAELQKEYGPKMGGFVKVYRKPLAGELNTTFGPSGYVVGEMGIVDDICPSRGVRMNNNYYPFFILETLDKRDFEGKMCLVQNGPTAKEYKPLSVFIHNGFTMALFSSTLGGWFARNINDVEFVKE